MKMIKPKSKVYFTKTINPQKLIEMYEVLKRRLPSKVAVKVHSGERGNKNFLKPLFLKQIVDYVHGTIVECNTAYPGSRNSTEKHKVLIKDHEWTKYYDVDIMDAVGPDITLEIPNGILLKRNYIGKNAKNYDSCLVISHFKGHMMGGYGGALKQLSIGFASTAGKALQHSAGRTDDQTKCWDPPCSDKEFKEAMADAAYSVVQFFKGKMAFINVMSNISIDCDCDGNAQEPCMKDIGILSSTDPVALDKACLDLIYNSKDKGKEKLIERIESKLGPYIIECSEKLGTGNSNYELIYV